MGEQVAAGFKKWIDRNSETGYYNVRTVLNNGGVAQLGEHLPCKQGVKSSNLSVPTAMICFIHIIKN